MGRVELVPSLLLHVRVVRLGELLLELLPDDLLLLRVQLLVKLMRPLERNWSGVWRRGELIVLMVCRSCCGVW